MNRLRRTVISSVSTCRLHARWLLPALLCVLPLLVYSNSIFAEYGLRDDYSILREAHEEPGKVFHGCAAQARPIYGLLLEQSFAHLGNIPSLAVGRLASALLLGLSAALAAVTLSRIFRWRISIASLTGALLVFLPGAQVVVSWSICWPFALGMLLAVAAFGIAHNAWNRPARLGRCIGFTGIAFGGLVISALIYPSETLLYVVFVAALIPLHRDHSFVDRARELIQHGLLLGGALAVAFLIAQLCFVSGRVDPSARVAFETAWADKAVWLVSNPLRDAFGLFALDDDLGRTQRIQAASIILALSLIAFGCALEFRRHGWRSGMIWAIGVLALPLVALCVNIIAAERWAPYRTLIAASGVVLVFAILGLRAVLSAVTTRPERWVAATLLGCACAAGSAARHQTFELIALPQMDELRLVREGSAQIDPERAQTILILRPSDSDVTLPVVFDDEFGSFSSNSEWTPQEMIKQVLHERFSSLKHFEQRSRMVVEWLRPNGKKWDVIVDLRHLAQTSSPAAAPH